MTLVDRATAEDFAVAQDSSDVDLCEIRSGEWSSDRPGELPAASSLWVRRLQRKLGGHRVVLADAWSDETMHPSFRAAQYDNRPASVGQCGASSAWLVRKLRWSGWFPVRYCFGNVLFADGADGVAEFHCWVEIGRESSEKRLVIDLTCDQFDEFEMFRGRQVLCEPYRNLTARSVDYRADSRRSLQNLRDDSVWERFLLLQETTSRARSSLLRGVRRKVQTLLSRPAIDQPRTPGAVAPESTRATAA